MRVRSFGPFSAPISEHFPPIPPFVSIHGVGQAYGIFHLAEFAVLTHLPLHQLPSSLGSLQAVLQRFGISP